MASPDHIREPKLTDALFCCVPYTVHPPSLFPRSSRSIACQSQVSPSPVARAYVERLESIGRARTQGGDEGEGGGGGSSGGGALPAWLLVPHAYTRYLGDLSGGQVLKRAAIRGLGLGPSDPADPGSKVGAQPHAGKSKPQWPGTVLLSSCCHGLYCCCICAHCHSAVTCILVSRRGLCAEPACTPLLP